MLESKDLTILFVDDEPSVLSSLRRFLRKEKYQTLYAGGAEEALKIIEKKCPAILVTDLRMPGMGGLDLIDRIKQQYPDILRLILSATRDLEETIAAINKGEVFRFITKPLEPESFKAILNDAIEYYLMKTERETLLADLEKSNARLKETLTSLTSANLANEVLENKARETEQKIEQQLLKSSPPQGIEGVSIDALSIASGHLDGDFFDFYAFSPTSFDLVIGDVMGKGLQSALVGAGIKQILLRALAGCGRPLPQTSKKQCENGENKILSEVFDEVHGSAISKLTDLEMFVTLCYARFDLEKQTLAFIDCGHTKTIHYSAAPRKASFLAGDNLPLGLVPEAGYTPERIRFSPGDIFLFYSDGVTEAENDSNEFYGPQRLASLVADNADLAAADLLKKIEEDVNKYTGLSSFTDDFTCIAVKIDQLT